MRKKKIRVAVLMGGPSSEHKVSLTTGRMVMRHLDRAKYSAEPVVVSKRGHWPCAIPRLKKDCDIAFIAMHGEYGEDGTLQAALEKHTIPFTGSGARASAFSMDKAISQRLFAKHNLTAPQSCFFTDGGRSSGKRARSAFLRSRTFAAFRSRAGSEAALVVKPSNRGSSIGISIARGEASAGKAILLALKHSRSVMIQKYVEGREFTCGVIETNGRPHALPPTEIIPRKRKFFDYHSKYTTGATAEITPALRTGTMTKRIQRIALTAHRAIGARGYSRTDMILGNDKKLYVLEINTLPGLTKNSLFPKGARGAGISFPKLLDLIIETGLQRS